VSPNTIHASVPKGGKEEKTLLQAPCIDRNKQMLKECNFKKADHLYFPEGEIQDGSNKT